MFKSLKSKLTIPTNCDYFAVVFGIVLCSSNTANLLADDLIWERAYASSRGAEAYVNQLQTQTSSVAYALAGDH